ncbi:MAG: lipopolysaccharide heptosyltransferase I [Candidatus Endonucleobacter bathymodioli]|uniref:Lipopolysaccharide heptosyltransferase 1 n=1 Tax=Candidatus Endonucleibacter bathymodioli TaxID=539814 RepID=A0AA90NS80_9GAMM|nr:lipopolysaccharide heptosyltransferase I [Candidatus Endonucleobacter bathymodioli]
MKVLLIKVSSMGDIIHTLPSLTDAALAIPGIKFDWVIEEAFSEIPCWHPAVDNIIPVALRRWRQSLLAAITRDEWRQFHKKLIATKYDAVIDAQGLLKSALLTFLAKGPSFGFDRKSARESISAYFYKCNQPICWNQHAVERIRQLLAQSLNYSVPVATGVFSLDPSHFDDNNHQNSPYVVFIHGTTRHDKHWPEPYWCHLANLANDAGYKILIPWGNDVEQKRANRIAQSSKNTQVLPKTNLTEIACLLLNASGVVSVDTGLGHLAAALEKQTVSLYGPTRPDRVGTYGESQIHLTLDHCHSGLFPPVDPDAFAAMTPELVWHALKKTLPQ